MSTYRYSGEVRIRVTYVEAARGFYRCFLKSMVEGIRDSMTVWVGVPAFLDKAVDCPEAYDDAAKAALAFAEEENSFFGENSAYTDDGRYVGRSYATRWWNSTEPEDDPDDKEPDSVRWMQIKCGKEGGHDFPEDGSAVCLRCGFKSPVQIPADFPVQPLAPGAEAKCRATCGVCGLSWDDGVSTTWTPTPSARCPFEYYHADPEPDVDKLGG